MKILCFGDLHIGSNHRFSQITSDGFTIREQEHLQCAKVLCDIIDQEEDIKHVIFLGDMFQTVGDSFSCQSLTVATNFIRELQQKCIEKRIILSLLVGNHCCNSRLDFKYTHKLYPFKYWEGVEVIDEPTTFNNIIYLPHCINDEYPTAFLENIPDKGQKVVFSHLDLKGVNLGNGFETTKGIDLDLLRQFKMTIHGHYHTGKNYGYNIQVCGSTQRLSFKDPGIARNNIIIYDTETNKIERRSFNCPDWLVFNDYNLDDFLKIDNNNYVKLELSTDILLTDDIKKKLDQMKGKEVQIDLTRISINRNITEDIKIDDEIEIIRQFINKSENTNEQKEALLETGKDLITRIK